MCTSVLKLMGSYENWSSSLVVKLIDWFLYEGNFGFKLIRIQFCEAKISEMEVGSRTPGI